MYEDYQALIDDMKRKQRTGRRYDAVRLSVACFACWTCSWSVTFNPHRACFVCRHETAFLLCAAVHDMNANKLCCVWYIFAGLP